MCNNGVVTNYQRIYTTKRGSVVRMSENRDHNDSVFQRIRLVDI